MLSKVTRNMHIDVSLNTNQLSSLVHTKPFPWKKEQPLHAPAMTVKGISFWSDWESTYSAP